VMHCLAGWFLSDPALAQPCGCLQPTGRWVLAGPSCLQTFHSGLPQGMVVLASSASQEGEGRSCMSWDLAIEVICITLPLSHFHQSESQGQPRFKSWEARFPLLTEVGFSMGEVYGSV
jgi:hypothetical protein